MAEAEGGNRAGPMRCGDYAISRESAQRLQKRLRNPSREYAQKREEAMREVHAGVHSSFCGDAEVCVFDDLDLSFPNHG